MTGQIQDVLQQELHLSKVISVQQDVDSELTMLDLLLYNGMHGELTGQVLEHQRQEHGGKQHLQGVHLEESYEVRLLLQLVVR